MGLRNAAAALLLLALLNVIHAMSLSAASTTCSEIECPAYELLYEGDDYSVRLYNNTVWMATSAIQDSSFVSATRTGFLKLFEYIQGANVEGVDVNMTAPVLTGVIPSEGPFCESSFVVRFYVPDAFQEEPPAPLPELELSVDRWDARLFGVLQFSGFATDDVVVQQAASLLSTLEEAGLSVASTTSSSGEEYLVAQYDSPYQLSSRLNEIWLPLSEYSMKERET